MVLTKQSKTRPLAYKRTNQRAKPTPELTETTPELSSDARYIPAFQLYARISHILE
ncbi:hypothetical protein GCM10027341_40770 [Spirosoma knui]